MQKKLQHMIWAVDCQVAYSNKFVVIAWFAFVYTFAALSKTQRRHLGAGE